MDIVIVAQYLLDITGTENLNSRFVYLGNLLKDTHQVEIVTSDFIHGRKAHVPPVDSYRGMKLTMLHEAGYKKNISLRRFGSHRGLARNIARYLKGRQKPDAVYCAVPSTDVAAAVARYCKKHNVPFILDIQDLWPEAFQMVLPLPPLFYPLAKQADRVYRAADALVAVSDTYRARAGRVNPHAPAAVVFLGTDKEQFDRHRLQKTAPADTLTLVYVGSLEKSYDLTTAIRAVARCRGVRLLVIGDGSRRAEWEALARESGAACEFTGYLPYSEMIARMSTGDMAINPIRKGSAGSIINKVGDYAMAGLPVINTQESPEYRRLLEEYEAGLNCACESVEEVAAAIERLARDEDLRNRMGARSRHLGETRFDRGATYRQIVTLIEDMGKE